MTTAKISRMLHQLEFKLQIERQYKQGIDKMAALYQAEGDRKSRHDAESKRVESQSKIMLLQQALKRYKQLHVMDDGEDDQRELSADCPNGFSRTTSLRCLTCPALSLMPVVTYRGVDIGRTTSKPAQAFIRHPSGFDQSGSRSRTCAKPEIRSQQHPRIDRRYQSRRHPSRSHPSQSHR